LKKILLITCLLCLASMCFAANTWTNSLKPKGTQDTFVVYKNGEISAVIVIPVKALPTEKKAAEELKTTFKAICGVDIPVVSEENMPKDKKIISVGNTSLARFSYLGNNATGIEEEGYSIVGKDGNLFLLGGSRRGPLYAAYALLEEDMGVRWYDKNGATRIPKSKDLIIKYVSRKFNPVFDTRFPGLMETFDADFCLKNRINPFFFATLPAELGGSTYPWGLCHTSFGLLSPDKYFATHPEYFSEVNGKRQPLQLCWSNPDVIKIVTERVREIFRSSDISYVAISPMDGQPLCDCVKCNELDKPEGTKAATLITALNQICNNIKEEFPDRKILTLAYLDYYVPPKTIKPVDNLTIQVCSDSHDWEFPFCTIPETDKFSQGLKKWTNVGAETIIWMYMNNYDHDIMANPNMELVGKNLNYLAKSGAGGVFMQGDCWGMGTDSGYMRAWVWGKQLWNPELNTKALMKDFIYGYYGASADPIWKYQELLLSLWEKNHKKSHNIRNKPYTPNSKNPVMVWDKGGIRWAPTISLYSKDFVKKSMVLLDDAEKKATTPEMVDRVRVMRAQMLYLTISQGVGYFNSLGDFFKSDELKSGDKSNFPYYLKLLNELEDTCNKVGIKKFAEVYAYDDAPVKMKKWRGILNGDLSAFPVIATKEEWNFITDPDNSGESKGYANADFDASKWKKIKTNACWEQQGFEDYNGYGWYKSTENVTSDMLSKTYLYLYFGAVDEEAWVYINGKLAFEHSRKSTGLPGEVLWNQPFIFDAKPFLKEGTNQITVKVFDVVNAGGIWKDVYFLPYDKVVTDAGLVKDSL